MLKHACTCVDAPAQQLAQDVKAALQSTEHRLRGMAAWVLLARLKEDPDAVREGRGSSAGRAKLREHGGRQAERGRRVVVQALVVGRAQRAALVRRRQRLARAVPVRLPLPLCMLTLWLTLSRVWCRR